MHNDERVRQAARRQRALTPPTPSGLVNVAKDQVKPFIQDDPSAKEHLRAFDCSVCKQRFVWDIRDTLKACPLCDAGAHQKPNKLPNKRLTHRQVRKLSKVKKANGKGTDVQGTSTNNDTHGAAAGAASEAQEQGSVRIPAA